MVLVKIVVQAYKIFDRVTIIDVANQLLKLDGVKSVDIKVNDVDAESIHLTISIEGIDLDFEKIRSTLDSLNTVISSVDEIIATKD
ncbi:MAG: DUF211 domain-containing protein [Ignisphaera sp.]